VTHGADLVRGWSQRAPYEAMFCGNCGSPLWSRNMERDEILVVRMGAFDGDPGIRPRDRQFVGSAAPWEPVPDDGLPRYPERRPSAEA
jgi:hypothetical protein